MTPTKASCTEILACISQLPGQMIGDYAAILDMPRQACWKRVEYLKSLGKVFGYATNPGPGGALRWYPTGHRVGSRMHVAVLPVIPADRHPLSRAWTGVRVERIYIAPEAPDMPSRGRKPSPQFLYDARDEYGLDLASSYMIGDKLIDLECGWGALD